ncbi:MAG: hypothetical protein AAFV77_11000 [Planctomycetota bacterium]
MSGSRDLIEKYTGTKPRIPAEDEQPAFDAGERYTTMLDCVLAGGDRAAFPYSMLLRATLNPSSGIELVFSGAVVTIRGRRLGELYRAIIQHRATSVKTSDGSLSIGDGSEERIESISIEIVDG